MSIMRYFFVTLSLLTFFLYKVPISNAQTDCSAVGTLGQYASCCDGSSTDSSACTTFANQHGGAGTTTNSCNTVNGLAQYSQCCSATATDTGVCSAFASAFISKYSGNSNPALNINFTPGGSTTPATTNQPLNIHLQNPLSGVSTIPDAINKILSVVIRIALPLIIIMFIWAGITFIFAQGNEKKITQAKNIFFYTIIGTLLILGAWTITNAIIGTVNSIVG
jgi:hypothetical protein